MGDKLISVNGTIIEGLSYSPTEVTDLIDASSALGYLQIQIMPIHALARRRGKFPSSNSATLTYERHPVVLLHQHYNII